MSVISRSALESSSLADLHEIASELALDGYRRLRKVDLIGAIIERQGGDAETAEAADAAAAAEADEATAPEADGDGEAAETSAPPAARVAVAAAARAPAIATRATPRTTTPRRSPPRLPAPARPARRAPRARTAPAAPTASARAATATASRPTAAVTAGDRDRDRDRRAATATASSDRSASAAEEREVSGTVELLPNGSGFLRVSPPEPSDDDVYISAAQVRRCELVSGDEVAGPVRAPRRSERYPSLIRVDTINGRSADEVSEGTKYDDLPCSYPTERIALDADDLTLKAIEWLTPFGRGSRVVIVGGPRSGKTEALRRLAGALVGPGRPRVLGRARRRAPRGAPGLALGPAAAGGRADAQRRIRCAGPGDRARRRDRPADRRPRRPRRRADRHARVRLRAGRTACAGGGPQHRRQRLADDRRHRARAARRRDDRHHARHGARLRGRIPSLDLAASGTVRPELLVGEKGAEAIAEARAAAMLA